MQASQLRKKFRVSFDIILNSPGIDLGDYSVSGNDFFLLTNWESNLQRDSGLGIPWHFFISAGFFDLYPRFASVNLRSTASLEVVPQVDKKVGCSTVNHYSCALFFLPIMAPKLRSSTIPQAGKTAANAPKTAVKLRKIAARAPKIAAKAPKRAAKAPKRATEAPKTAATVADSILPDLDLPPYIVTLKAQPAAASAARDVPFAGKRTFPTPPVPYIYHPKLMWCLRCLSVKLNGFLPNPGESFGAAGTLCCFEYAGSVKCAGCRAASHLCEVVCAEPEAVGRY